MKSEQGIGDMKWKGRKAERERGHSVLFLMRWSSDISALRGCADPLPVAAGSHPAVWRRLAECRPADQCIYNINQPKEKGKSDHNVFMYVCVCEAWCVFSWFASSAACLLMRGDLTDCPMWLLLRRGSAALNPPPQRPHQSSENTVEKREETHRHRLTRYKNLAPAKVTQ